MNRNFSKKGHYNNYPTRSPNYGVKNVNELYHDNFAFEQQFDKYMDVNDLQNLSLNEQAT